MQRSAINRLRSLPGKKASFVEPMECLSVPRLPESSQWLWEIKLDGYRALAVKSGRDVTLFSRRRKSLNRQFPYIVERLADLPRGTVVDGELVAIDDRGRPDFHLLQNFRSAASSGVRSKAANGDHVKSGQRMWPGTRFFYPIFS
jgi:ATP-dependent DNA ligase